MTAPENFDLATFLAERDAAMLSLDRDAIVAFATKYRAPISPDEDVFWAGVHKTRTAIKTLPREARLLSKRWLEERGSQSLDDGDLGDEVTP